MEQTIRSKNLYRKLYRLIAKIFNYTKSQIPQFSFTIRSDASNLWSSSKKDEAVMHMSHWRGKGRYTDEEKWRSIGIKHFRMIEEFIHFLKVDKQIRSIVEWGSGGGANAVKFVEMVDTFYGVDISDSNLKECDRQLEKIGFTNFRKIHIDIDFPEKSLEFLEKPVDLFLSTAVYQHFPSQEYGRQITKIAWKMLSDEGLALIQIRYDDGSRIYKTKKGDYKKNWRVFTSFQVHTFWQICQEIGFKPIFVRLEPDVNYAFFFLKKIPRTI